MGIAAGWKWLQIKPNGGLLCKPCYISRFSYHRMSSEQIGWLLYGNKIFYNISFCDCCDNWVLGVVRGLIFEYGDFKNAFNEAKRSRDSVVRIATGYGLDDRAVGVRVPVGSRIFSFPCPDRLWGPPNSYPMATGGSFPGGKAAGARSWPITSS
jgi:hypothetical protein